MSWYVAQDGTQVWVGRDESVYTVIHPSKELQVDELTYLTTSTKKAAYQEHMMDQGIDGKVSGRQRAKMTGRQRGFIVRVDQEENVLARVVTCFKAAAGKLLESGVVTRIDAEDAANAKKKKKDKQIVAQLAVNECRVETTARINHFAHGPGFRVDVQDGDMHQRIHFFTGRQQMPSVEWHACLVTALETCGSHVMLARRKAADAEGGANDGELDAAATITLRKDKAQQDEQAWLDSVMAPEVAEISAAEDDDSDEGGSDEDGRAADAPPPRQGFSPDPGLPPGPRQDAKPNMAMAAQRPVPPPAAAQASRDPAWRPNSRPPPDSWRAPAAPSQRGPQPPSQHGSPSQHGPASRQNPQQQKAGASGRQRAQQKNQNDLEPWRAFKSPQQQSSRQGSHVQQPKDRGTQPRDNADWRGASQGDPSVRSAVRGGGPSNGAAAQSQGRPQAESQAPRSQSNQQDSGFLSWWDRNALKQAEQSTQSAQSAQSARPTQASSDSQPEAATCGECNRGRPLKLWQDSDDMGWYCRMCWVDFYGMEPPSKPR